MRLTNIVIESASKKVDKNCITLKDDTPGLSLRIFKNGTKVWIVRKVVNYKEYSKIIGKFPELSIAEARQKARETVESFIQKNSITAKINEEDLTFENIFTEWMDFKKGEIKDWKRQEGCFKQHVLPIFSKLKLSEIKPVMIRAHLLELIKNEGKFETAKRICIWIGQLERFALGLGYVDNLRLQNLSKLLPSTKHKNMPSIPPSQLDTYMPTIITACADSQLMWDTLRLAFYTLLRPSEYTSMEWSWIKENHIEIPAEIMKMKRAHRVPITSQIREVLDNRPCSSRYVLPSPRANKPITINALAKVFSRHGLSGILVPHGIRSIGRTWMAEKGVDTNVAEACLAHRLGNTVQITYNRSDLLDLRRSVMQEWCDFVSDSIRRAAKLNQAAPNE